MAPHFSHFIDHSAERRMLPKRVDYIVVDSVGSNEPLPSWLMLGV